MFDEMLECAGKVYTIIKTQEGESNLSDDQILYGAFFKTSENFAYFAKKEIEIMKNVLAHNPKAVELSEKIEKLQAALDKNEG